MADDAEAKLHGLVDLWLSKIRHARDHKEEVFGRDAAEAMKFYSPPKGNYNFMYGAADAEGGWVEPEFKMALNKVAELVAIFGPILYARNPNRQVNRRQPVEMGPLISASPTLLAESVPPDITAMLGVPLDPVTTQMLVLQAIGQQEQAKADRDAMTATLLEAYLNWTPNELKLRDAAGLAIDEALIKGRGCLWTELVDLPGGPRMVGTRYESVDYLLIDPDAEKIEEAWWVARECCHPVWEVERMYGLRPGSLRDRGTIESYGKGVETDASNRTVDRQRGKTNDLMTYYKVYSRMGVGGRLSGSDLNRLQSDTLPGDLADISAALDPLAGDHAYLVIAPGVPHPLNLPLEMLDGVDLQRVAAALQWPVPFWADRAWPVSVLDFHPVPRRAWPMSHIKPAMGLLKFINWAYSFLAGKLKVTSRDIVGVLKELNAEFKKLVSEGVDLTVVELDTNNRSINECVQVLQFPEVKQDILNVVAMASEAFDKATGLNEIFYGNQARQDRSATESNLKAQNVNIRPDDMAERVESWMTEVARKEAIAARLQLQPADVAPILGPTAAMFWGRYVAAPDIGAARELEYRIEAGSTRKPNRARDKENAEAGLQNLLPFLSQYAGATGQVGPVNALIGMWAKANDIPPAQFLIQPMPPPPVTPPPPGEGDGPPPEGA